MAAEMWAGYRGCWCGMIYASEIRKTKAARADLEKRQRPKRVFARFTGPSRLSLSLQSTNRAHSATVAHRIARLANFCCSSATPSDVSFLIEQRQVSALELQSHTRLWRKSPSLPSFHSLPAPGTHTPSSTFDLSFLRLLLVLDTCAVGPYAFLSLSLWLVRALYTYWTENEAALHTRERKI